MPINRRIKTKYPGVYYVMGVSPLTGKLEKIYYIRYRKDGKEIEEKAGRQYQHAMTPARASTLRSQKIKGNKPSNREKRESEEAKRRAQVNIWSIDRLWDEYKSQRPDVKSVHVDDNRYEKYIKPKFGGKEPKELIKLEVDRLRINLLKKRSPKP